MYSSISTLIGVAILVQTFMVHPSCWKSSKMSYKHHHHHHSSTAIRTWREMGGHQVSRYSRGLATRVGTAAELRRSTQEQPQHIAPQVQLWRASTDGGGSREGIYEGRGQKSSATRCTTEHTHGCKALLWSVVPVRRSNGTRRNFKSHPPPSHPSYKYKSCDTRHGTVHRVV